MLRPCSSAVVWTSSPITMGDIVERRPVEFERDVVPLLFGDTGPEEEPALVLLNDTAGTGRSRATAAVTQQHPGIAVISDRDLQMWATASANPGGTEREGADWLQRCIGYARTHRRSILLEGSSFSTASLRAATAFAASGFTTRVAVVGVRPAEALLADASRFSAATLAGSRTSLTDVDRAVRGARELVQALVNNPSVDRLTVISRDGDVEFDARAGDGSFTAASSGLEAALTRRLTSLRAAQWLSELRRVTEFAETLQGPREFTERLIALHGLAVREIIPELDIPTGSPVAALQEQRSAAALASLRRSLAPTRPREDLASPVISAPSGPDRGLGR